MAAGLACAAVAANGTAVAAADTETSGQSASDSTSASAPTRTADDSDADASADDASDDATRDDSDSDAADDDPSDVDVDPDVDVDADADAEADADADADTDEAPEAPTSETSRVKRGDRHDATVAEDTPRPRTVAREPETPAVRQDSDEAEPRQTTVANTEAADSASVSAAVETPVATDTAAATPVVAASTVRLATATSTSTSTPAPTTPVKSVSFFTLLQSAWRRMWSNSTPTLPSREVTVTLTDSAGVSAPISFGGSDADGDPVTYSVTAKGTKTGPKYGTVTIDQATGTFVYNPDDALTSGVIRDTFTVTIRDSGSHSHGLFGWLKPLSGHGSTATITVVVGAVNQAPKAVDDNFSGIVNSPVAGNVLTNDTDYEGQALTAKVVAGPKFGALNFQTDGSFTYTPNANFTGTDAFTYTASDGVSTSVVAQVKLAMAGITPGATPTIGVQGLSWWLGLSDADTNRALDMSKAAGVTSLRIDISWQIVEWTKGTLNYSMIDPLVDKAIARDMSVLGMLYDTPQWLSGSTNPHAVPANPALFAQFAAATAQHYLGKIDTWEIWNEQNIPRFWASPNPAAYAALLKAVYPAIKAVDPSATVITGGLSPDGSGIKPLDYVKAMYAAGAGGYFDALSMHPYAFPSLPTIDSVKAVHEVMVSYGDGAKKIWLTEVGAPTGTSPFAVSEAVQAQTIKMYIDFARTYDYVGPVYLYSILDTGTSLSDPEDNFGLIRRDFTTKPAFGIWL